MAQTELLRGLCPKCGEPLEIPAHLKQFSCMYCGARLSPYELRTEQEERTAVCTEDAAEAAAFYREHILETITKHIGIEKEVTKNAYAPAFERYTNSCAPTFRQLNQAVCGNAITIEDAVIFYLDALKDRWDSQKSWKQSFNNLLEMDKFVIAIYLVPMIQELKLPISEEYCKILHEKWIERYPNFPFYIGTYQDLSAGFNRKFLGLCFITTAVCRHSGKPDDCAELTAFRGFRDGYLRACPDGPALIDKYYNIAPGIVLHLDLSSDRDRKYQAIRETYLEPCFADIQAGRLNDCKDRYTEMVLALEQEYLT